APAAPRAAGPHAAADPARAPGSPAPPAAAAPGVPGPVGATGTAEADAPYEGESPSGLTPDFLLPGRRRAPAPGWRRVVYPAAGPLGAGAASPPGPPAGSCECRRPRRSCAAAT